MKVPVFAMILSFCLWLMTGCLVPGTDEPGPADYAEEMAQWDEKRIEGLKGEAGWLNLAGLFWLVEGENSFGADSSNLIVFPGKDTPPFLGFFRLSGGHAVADLAEGTGVTSAGKPVNRITLHPVDTTVVLSCGNLRWFIIERNGRFAVRLRDLKYQNIDRLSKIERYPPDLSWRITARFHAYRQPDTLLVPNVLGTFDKAVSYGKLVFSIGGKRCSLVPTGEPDRLFVVFADQTSDVETYSAGRFLYPEKIRKGRYLLDFNKAFNPPCAFTPFATCPLPRKENFLPFGITAGEKKVDLIH